MFIFFSELVHNSSRVYQSVRGAREDIPSGGGKERRHMKTLIVLAVGLLAAGCGKTEQPVNTYENKKRVGFLSHRTEAKPVKEPTPITNTNKVDGSSKKPVKEQTPEEKIMGTYERKGRVPGSPVKTIRFVFLDNGVFEQYNDDQKEPQSNKWSIVDNEVHVKYAGGSVSCFQINPDNSLSYIVYIMGGKRTDIPKQDQQTYKKLK